MNTYLIYDLDDRYLGEVLARTLEDARVLADQIIPLPHRVLTFRLTYNRHLAA